MKFAAGESKSFRGTGVWAFLKAGAEDAPKRPVPKKPARPVVNRERVNTK